MSRPPRVMIAGAGVLGLATAIALADAGCAVTVSDPADRNASSVAAGMIAPVFEAALDETARPHFELLLAARNLWPALAARTGIELDRSGALAVGAEDWLDGLSAALATLNVRPTDLGADTAQALAPGLSADFPRALLTREDWRVDAPVALAAMRRAAEASGVQFRPWRVPGRGNADVLVVATGASADLELAPELSRLSPIKGHIVRVAEQAVGAVVRSRGIYAAPGAEMAFGATMEPGLNDAEVDPAKAEPLLAAGLRLFPGLAGAPATFATGVRAATPDGLPMVGASAEPAVVLAVGPRRNGWLLAPLVARMVTALVMSRDPGPYAGQFDPRRFRS